MALKSFAASRTKNAVIAGFWTFACVQNPAITGNVISDLGPTPSRVETMYRIADDGRAIGCIFTPEGRTQAALWKNGTRTLLPALSPELGDSQATAFTDTGEPIGILTASSDDRKRRAIVWRDGKPVFIDADANRSSVASAANGVIVGQAATNAGRMQAALWRSGAVQFLGVLGKGDSSAATGVNDKGQIVGFSNAQPDGKNRAFVWENGTMRELATLPGGATAQARAINNKGQIVGWSDAKNEGLHAVLWENANAAPKELGTLGDEPSAAWDINENGDIVGGSSVNERVYHAFLYRKGKMQDLNALLPPDSGWKLRLAQSLNNHNQIVGIGQYQRERRAFLLTVK